MQRDPISPGDTVYVVRGGRWHTSPRCAGRFKSHVMMTARMVFGSHQPCGNCVGDADHAALREALG